MNSSKKKNILFITGTRADFGKLKVLMLAVENSNLFNCHIFVTGMHLLEKYGSTYDEIRKCGFKNIFLFMNQYSSESNEKMDLILGKTVDGIGHYIREFQTDLIVVHGDRLEALSGAIVGSLNNILVSHIEGGELSGTIDELIRHSISKLSHTHFVSNKTSKNRLIQMGEEAEKIYVIGSPEVDIILYGDLPNIKAVKERYDITYNKYNILIYHPVTSELKKLRKNIRSIMKALDKTKSDFVVIFPNNDSGSEIIINEFEKYKNNSHFKFFPSLRFEYYITLMKNANSIIGNSSAGVREAPVFGLPSINIGSRQKNRTLSDTIINIDHKENLIIESLLNITTNVIPSIKYGKGNSAKLFIETILKDSFWRSSTQKQFRDIKKGN